MANGGEMGKYCLDDFFSQDVLVYPAWLTTTYHCVKSGCNDVQLCPLL